MRAIGLVRPIPEEAHDAHSSSDNERLTESDINNIPEDALDAAGCRGGARRRRGGPADEEGAAGGAGAAAV